MFFGLIAILYSLLVYKGKYLEILKKYDEEPKEAKIKGRILIILYLIGSVGLLVFSFYLMMKKNRGEL